MLRLLTATSLLSLAIVLPAIAQTGNPAFTPSGTPAAKPGVPAPHQLNTADRTVIHQLAIGNAAEIELGKLAQQKAQGQPAKGFAETMVRDHEATGKRLADLAEAAGLPLPSGLDDEHRAMREHLDKLTGTAFDVTYIQGQIQIIRKRYTCSNTRSAAGRIRHCESSPLTPCQKSVSIYKWRRTSR